MRIARTIAELPRGSGTVGLVPTMGAFHAGHESLIRAAREENDVVVVSLFVNPAQFNDPRDLEAYPRDERRDGAIAERHGADILFAPAQDEVYRAGASTKVIVEGLGEVFEGAHRGPGHFAGVCTVVAKVAVLKRMVADLDFPLEIRVQPTIRDPDGLALSSRNARLTPEERQRALAINAALQAAAQGGLGAGEAVLAENGIEPEYFAAVDPETFETPGDLIVIAATIGTTRLIDNAKAATPERRGADPKGAVSVLPTP